MSVIIRFIILICCACAGSLVAKGQFSDLPADNYEVVQR
jgi:hypothetical protein